MNGTKAAKSVATNGVGSPPETAQAKEKKIIQKTDTEQNGLAHPETPQPQQKPQTPQSQAPETPAVEDCTPATSLPGLGEVLQATPEVPPSKTPISLPGTLPPVGPVSSGSKPVISPDIGKIAEMPPTTPMPNSTNGLPSKSVCKACGQPTQGTSVNKDASTQTPETPSSTETTTPNDTQNGHTSSRATSPIDGPRGQKRASPAEPASPSKKRALSPDDEITPSKKRVRRDSGLLETPKKNKGCQTDGWIPWTSSPKRCPVCDCRRKRKSEWDDEGTPSKKRCASV